MSVLPPEVGTERCVLRPWHRSDAAALKPILDVNYAHLAPWIPARIATSAAIDTLEARLDGFQSAFEANTEWRYAMLLKADNALLGEISIFPRSSSQRVPFSESSCVEIGYWMRSDTTGRGLVTECVRAVMEVLFAIPRFDHIEIRCDARNLPSTAIPKRLGYTLSATLPDQLQVWTIRPTRQVR